METFLLLCFIKKNSVVTHESVSSSFMLSDINTGDKNIGQSKHYRRCFQVLKYGMFTRCLWIVLTHIRRAYFLDLEIIIHFQWSPSVQDLRFSRRCRRRFKYYGMLRCILGK